MEENRQRRRPVQPMMRVMTNLATVVAPATALMTFFAIIVILLLLATTSSSNDVVGKGPFQHYHYVQAFSSSPSSSSFSSLPPQAKGVVFTATTTTTTSSARRRITALMGTMGTATRRRRRPRHTATSVASSSWEYARAKTSTTTTTSTAINASSEEPSTNNNINNINNISGNTETSGSTYTATKTNPASTAMLDGDIFQDTGVNSTTEILVEESTASTSSLSSSSPSSSSYPPTPTIKDCLAFTLPALGIWACPPLMSLIDASFIGQQSLTVNKYASLELAALGPASSISDSAPLPLLFLSIAATNLIAAATTASTRGGSGVLLQDQSSSSSTKQQQRQLATPDQARITRVALGMGTIGGIILATALYFGSGPLSALYCGAGAKAAGVAGSSSGTASIVASFCQQYVGIRSFALPAVVFTTIAQAVCIGTKDTTTPMYAVLIAAVLNLTGDFILVKKFQMGIAGAAWATSISQIVAGGLLLRVLKRRGFLRNPSTTELQATSSSSSSTPKLVEEQSESSLPSSSPTTMDTIKQLLAFVPFLFVMSVKIGWHNSCAATAASLGGAQAAAHSALVSVAMLCFVLGDVGSSMSQAFLPAFVKKTTKQDSEGNDPKEPTTPTTTTKMTTDFDLDAAMPTIKQLLRCTLGISSTVMVIAAIIIGIFPTNITRDPAVVAEMRKTLPWIVTALSFHGSAVTLEGLLLARKKFRPLSVIYSLLAIGVAGFQLVTRQFHLGLGGVWACYVWFCATRVFVFSSIGGLFQPMKFLQRIRNKFAVNAVDDRKASSSSVVI